MDIEVGELLREITEAVRRNEIHYLKYVIYP